MDILKEFLNQNNITKDKALEVSPLVLAYIGDALFELYIRVVLIGRGEVKPGKLHKSSIAYVKASAQADIVKRLSDVLTFEESEVIRRGRNITPASPPKNADIMDYRYATGFEALIGYLYLRGENERLFEILKLSIER
jgi:ribonuclease-3 family protein